MEVPASSVTMAGTESIDYRNKIILAPMVRVSTLPTRLLTLRYGADLVYCEEIIDFKILAAKRVENAILDTVDYMLSDDTVVFRTCAEEKGKVIFQLGTSNAKRALSAARKIEKDVAGIDVNMGCPKEFSIRGGMGAALLTQPDKVKEILTTLVNGLSIPVTCKIRLLPKLEDTLALVQMIEKTGVAAIAVHGRLKEERPRHPNRNHDIKVIAGSVDIPVIANGGSKEINCYSDIENFLKETGCTSTMLARAAEWNPSIFRKEGKLPLLTVAKEYVKVALEMDNVYTNIKYCVLMMMHADMDLKQGQKMLEVMSQEEISEVWELQEYFKEIKTKWKEKAKKLNFINKDNPSTDISVTRADDGTVTMIEMPVRFIKKDYPQGISSKQRLFEWLRRYNKPKPLYESSERPGDRYYNTVLTLGSVKYKSSHWEKSKQLAEQGAAIVASVVLNIDDGRLPEVAVQTENVAAKWRQLCMEQPSLSKIRCDSFRDKSMSCEKNVSKICDNIATSAENSNIKHLEDSDLDQRCEDSVKTIHVMNDMVKRKRETTAENHTEDATKRKCTETQSSESILSDNNKDVNMDVR